MKKFLSNSSGFSLAEVLVAAGMLGVVSLGVMQLISNMTKGQKKLGQDSMVSSISLRADQVLRRENNCSATFRDKTIEADDWEDINTIFRATNDWQRSDALDIAGNKVAAFTAGNVYGGSSDRVRLSGIAHRAFFDSSETSYATGGNYNTGNIESTYDYFNDAGATDFGSTPQDEKRRKGVLVVRLEFQRQVNLRSADEDEVKDQHQKRSFGSETTYKYIAVEVVTNSTGVIQSCFSDTENYLSSSCDTLDGNIEDGKCKNITVKNKRGGAEPAVKVSGNMEIVSNIADTATDMGSVGVGMTPNTLSESNVDIAGSVGVGIISTTTPGDLSVKNSVGIDVAPDSANSGNLSVNRSVGIGIPPTSSSGNLSVNTSVGIGTTPTSSSGDLSVGSSVGIGTVPTSSSGDLSVGTSVGIGVAPTSSSGTLKVNKSASIGSGTSPSSADGDLTVKTTVNVGESKTILIKDGKITTSENFGNNVINAQKLNDKDFVTREWVDYAIAATLKTDDLTSTIAGFINDIATPGDTYDTIRKAICNTLIINGTSSTTGSCERDDVGKLSVTYFSSTNTLTLKQADSGLDEILTLKDCSQNGLCSSVYANYAVRGYLISAMGRSSTSYDSNGYYSVTGRKICIYGNCRTTFGTQKCGTGEVAVAIGVGGTLGCVDHHPWPQ